MLIKSTTAILLASFALVSGLAAQVAPKVRVAGVQVIYEALGGEDDEKVPFNTFGKGTSLALIVEAGGSSFIKFDKEASSIESFVDDLGGDLMVKSSKFQRNGFGSFPKIGEAGKAVLIEISAGGVPGKEAGKVAAKGTLVMVTGSQTKKVKSEPFEAKKGAKVTVGDIEMTVSSAGEPDYGEDSLGIEFQTSNKAISTLAGVKFFDASGAEIESEEGGSGYMGFGKNYTYNQSYTLKKEVKGKLVVQFELWTDLKKEKIPFSIAAGVGR